MRRRSSPPDPCVLAAAPHSGQAASAVAPPPEPGPPPLVRETSPPPPPPSAPPPPLPAATAARAAAALVSGLPQSEQNCAPASFCRPQYWQALRAIKLGGPIYCSTLPCATCDSCVSRCLSPRRAARLLPQPVVSLPPQRQSPVRASHSTSPSSIPTLPSRSRRRIRHSCSEVSAAGVAMSVRATPGARVRLRMEGKQGEVWFVPDTLPEEPAWGVRVFGTDTSAYRLPPAADRYVAWLPATPLCDAMVEAIVGTDTARAVWPLVLDTLAHAHPIVVVLNDDTAHTGKSDSLTVGKAVPYGTYNWFFPLGTTSVATARWGSQTRLQLSRGTIAWVNTADVVPLAPGTPPPGGIVGSVRLTAGPRSLVLRVPLPTHVPYKVEEDEKALTLRLYGVASDVNWMQYGGTDPYVTRMSYAQPASDEVTITVSLAGPVWGYRTRWSGRDLLLEIRRPPVIDPRRPLAGRTIVLDPGHPPLGAKGPAGLWEPVATLAVAEQAKALLERAGATVLLTRTDSTPIDLFPRARFAEEHDADVLVSIHANALPDGVNPFINNGTSVYYFHPRSAALARDLDRALVGELGVRDLGMGRGDYALVRNPWFPSALTEGLFMMIPEQEAMLSSTEGRLRYARGVAKGIEEFLREMAR